MIGWGRLRIAVPDEITLAFWRRALGPMTDGDPYVVLAHTDTSSLRLDLESDEVDRPTDRRSPGGLDFGLVPVSEHGRRPAPFGPPGRRSRLVQLCIDAPAHLHDAEVEFWRRTTGWRFQGSDRPEFAGTLYPAACSSIELLLQRLDLDSAATRVGLHLDLGCDDHEAEADRLIGLGAERVGEGAGWITLRDPAGMIFCATSGRSPDGP